jgi:hypothetical protein
MFLEEFWGNVLYFIIFLLFIFFYPRLMVMQILLSLEHSAKNLEILTQKGKSIVIRKVSKKPGREIVRKVSEFLDFFVIEPVNLDPFGIIKKIEHILTLSENRIKEFVKSLTPNFNPEERANLVMGLSGAISLNQVAKIVRHYVELIKKTKNLQLAIVLQMQLPLIEKISKALFKGTEAFVNGWPVGDTIGALAISSLITKRAKEIEEDTLLAQEKIGKRKVYLIKAKGPGGRLGKLGKAVEKIVKKEKIAKIITVDAAAKLEGEKTGSVAEGVGVAIGGAGVDRAYIENIATKGKIPLDSIIIKMSQEEALIPMKKEILFSIPNVIEKIRTSVSETKGKGKIIIVGVGNTCGVGNSKKNAKETEEKIKKIAKIMEEREKEEKAKEKKSFLDWLTGF